MSQTVPRSAIVRPILWLSLALNLLLGILAGTLWLDQRAARLGLDTRGEALKSLLGPKLLSRSSITMQVAEESSGRGLTRVEVPPRGEVFYAHGMASIGNRDIAAARVVETSYGSHDVEITFTSEGSARIKSLTEQNLGKRLVISVDGTPILAPVIEAPIDAGHTRISGAFTKDEAKRIVLALSRR